MEILAEMQAGFDVLCWESSKPAERLVIEINELPAAICNTDE
jgi:hypothetical protein